jgi:hypothetical protein
VYYVVSRLIAMTDISRMTQEDTLMGDATVSPMTRSNLAQYWNMRAEKLKWEAWQQLEREYPRASEWAY